MPVEPNQRKERQRRMIANYEVSSKKAFSLSLRPTKGKTSQWMKSNNLWSYSILSSRNENHLGGGSNRFSTILSHIWVGSRAVCLLSRMALSSVCQLANNRLAHLPLTVPSLVNCSLQFIIGKLASLCFSPFSHAVHFHYSRLSFFLWTSIDLLVPPFPVSRSICRLINWHRNKR